MKTPKPKGAVPPQSTTNTNTAKKISVESPRGVAMRETPTSTASLPLTKARLPLKSITNTTPSTSVKSLDQAFSAVMTQDENDTTYTDHTTHRHYTATGTVIKPSKPTSGSGSSQDSTIYESTASATAATVHKPPIKRRRGELSLSSTTAATTSMSDKLSSYTSSSDVYTLGYTAAPPLLISPPPRVRKIKVSNEIIVSTFANTHYLSTLVYLL